MTGGFSSVFDAFRREVARSNAVFCRSVSQIKEVVSSDNQLYVSFYQMVGMGSRRPEETTIERERLLADDLLFPFYREQICFAALSLNAQGASSWGNCSVQLRADHISGSSDGFRSELPLFLQAL
jgi:hypothetical protein